MIKKFVSLLLLIPLTSWCAELDCFPKEMLPGNMFPMVKLETSKGDIVVELNRLPARTIFYAMYLRKSMTGPFFTALCPGSSYRVVVTQPTFRKKPCTQTSVMNLAMD